MNMSITERAAHLAKYSDLAYEYKAPNIYNDPTKPNTLIDFAEDPDTGFYAAAYQDPTTGKVIVAFRGTDQLGDVSGANAALLKGSWDPQFDQAIDFLNNVAAQEYRNSADPVAALKSDVLVTGHSLGGALAQITAQLYGLDGATFDPAGAYRQTTLQEYQNAAARVGINPASNQVSADFRNYQVDGSLVSSGTGPHIGTSRVLPQFDDPGLMDGLKSLAFGAAASNPVMTVLSIAVIDQFGYKHPVDNVANSVGRLASLETDPNLNPGGGELIVRIVGDGSYVVETSTGITIGAVEFKDGKLRLTAPNGTIAVIGENGFEQYIAPQPSGFQTLINGVEHYGPAVIDALSVIRAIQSGEPLPITASGLRLANDLNDLNGNAPNYELSGAANVASGILSLMSLDAALERGDTLGAVTAGAQALSFGAKAYLNFAQANQIVTGVGTATDISTFLNGSTNGVPGALPYLSLINSIANGDEVGAAVSIISMAVPAIGIAYAVYSIVDSLFGGDDIPDPWGSGKFVWDGTGIRVQAVGETGGDQAVSSVMEGVVATLNALIEREREQNPGSQLGIIPNRMPTVGYDMSGFRYTDIDPLTGEEKHPSLRFDTSGNPYNAEPGSPEAYQSLIEGMVYSALGRGAIAPLWEVQTAKMQTDAGDPRAGLTEEERAGRDGQLAAPVEGDTQIFRPVALDLDGDGIETVARADSGISFNVDDSGYLKHTGWLNGDDAFLTLDRNYNGQTDSGKEMFSNAAVALGRRGLAGMAWVDANYDGMLTSDDPVWSELKVWRDLDQDGIQDEGEAQGLDDLGITELNYAMGTFTQDGAQKQLASPDLEADKDGTRVSIVPEGILIQESSEGHLSLLVTRIDDKTAVEANRDGITGYEDTEIIVSSADLLANDTLGGFLGRDLTLTGLANFRHGTGFIDANGFIHFQPEPEYAGDEAGFDYTVRAVNGQEGTATVDITLQNVNDAPTLDDVDHTTRPVYGYTPIEYTENNGISVLLNYVSGGEPIYEPYAIATKFDPTTWTRTTEYVYDPEPGHSNWDYHTTPIAYEDTGAGQVNGTDVDDPDSSLTYELVGNPQYGAVTVNADGTFQYTSWKEPGVPSDYIVEDGQYGGVKNNKLYTQSNLPSYAVYPETDEFLVKITDPNGASTIESISVPHYGPYLPPTPPGGGGKKPIAVDLNGNGFEFVNVDDSNVFFDVNGDGWKQRTSWVGKDDGLLVYDVDGDGKIDKPGEISFAGYTDGAQSDLEGLAAFDTNGDGRFDANDDEWAKFGIWQDANQNGITDAGELRTLDEMGVTAVGLNSDGNFEVINGQTVHGVGAMEMADGSQMAIADVTFSYSNETQVTQPDGTTGTVTASPFSPSGEEINGTEENDLILGKNGNNIINAYAGDDVIFEDGGNDVIDGGDGNDMIYAGADNDLVLGGDGNDAIYAGLGDDVVFGGDGHDAIFAEGGNDVVFAGNGNDVISGGWGNDVLSGDDGNDQVYGEAGSDALFGRAGNDELLGMDGNDRLDGGTGHDLLDGGAGADEMIGGTGNDTYVVDDLGDTVTELTDEGLDSVRASIDYVLGGNVENLTLTGTANLSGSGNALDNHLTGNSGDNRLDGGEGDDLLNGGMGADSMSGGAGNDTYVVDNAGDVVNEASGEGLDNVRASVSYVLAENVENLILTGSADISGSGNGLGNMLVGNSGNNVLDGGIGADAMRGGAGDDTYIVDETGDMVAEAAGEGIDTVVSNIDYALGANLENLVLGGNMDLAGTGNELDNVLVGNIGSNVLDGGTGADTMSGGAGDDTYSVDNAGDTVTEGVDAGVDQVFSSVSYGLSDQVENLFLTGTEDIDGTGNALDNVLTGNLGNNVLDGGTGADAMSGGAGNDTYLVDEAGDSVIENTDEGIDTVVSAIDYTLGDNFENLSLSGAADIVGTGNAFDNVLIGNIGNNILDGGAGADTMSGGEGDDTYLVDQTGDSITENIDEGVDTVVSAIGYTLGANLENLILTGNEDIDGTGNALDNVLTGNSGNNILDGGVGGDAMSGGAGDDSYIVDNAGDMVSEVAGEGLDIIYASISYVLPEHVENLTLTGTEGINATGNALDNVLRGNSGSNVLDGGVGVDAMSGGAGDDSYIVDNAGDTVSEAASGGLDTIYASVSYVLPEHVENLILIGDGNVDAGGNDLDNQLVGNSGDNSIAGGAGNDLLDGAAGNDTLDGGIGDDLLIGGDGDDTYLINQGDGLDRIEESTGTDTVHFGEGLSLDNVALRVTETDGVHTAHVRVLNAGGCEQDDQGFDFEVSVDEYGRYVSPIEQFTFADGSQSSFDDLLIKTRVYYAWPYAHGNMRGRDGDIIFDGQHGGTTHFGFGHDHHFGRLPSYEIVTGRDDDIIYAGPQSETIRTGSGHDIVYASQGNDTVYGEGGNDVLYGGNGNDTLDGACGTDILDGSSGRDTLRDLGGNNALLGGYHDDVIEAGSGADFIAGGRHDDIIQAGGGANIIAFNRGDGRDTVLPGMDASNTLSLGGGIEVTDLAFHRRGQDLLLQVGRHDQITFKDWYSSEANQNFVTLQIVEERSFKNWRHWRHIPSDVTVESYDFRALVEQSEAAQANNPRRSSWSLMHGRLDAHLATSGSQALGGELAMQYAKNGTLAMSPDSVRQTLQDPDFGQEEQSVGKRFDGFVHGYRIG